MVYVVKVYHNGICTIDRLCHSIAEVETIQAIYDGIPGYEVDFQPDVFRYLRLNSNAALS